MNILQQMNDTIKMIYKIYVTLFYRLCSWKFKIVCSMDLELCVSNYVQLHTTSEFWNSISEKVVKICKWKFSFSIHSHPSLLPLNYHVKPYKQSGIENRKENFFISGFF